MQTTRYLTPSGKNVELVQVAEDRYLLCSEPPRFIAADEVETLYHQLEDRRARGPRRHDRSGGRRRRDRISLAEDQLRARTHEMVRFAELSLARVRSWSTADYPIPVIE